MRTKNEWLLGIGVAILSFAAGEAVAQTITQIIDSTGDGGGNTVSGPQGIAVDGSGNVYVLAQFSVNGFKITPGGVITEMIDSTGDGVGNGLTGPRDVAVGGSGNVYLTGQSTHNAFKITPGGVITEIIDNTGDGMGNSLGDPFGVAVDASGNVYVAGLTTDNAFKITPGGVVSEIIDATGDGGGNLLDGARGVVVDTSGNVYVVGTLSDNVFKITPDGVITEIIDATGDGGGNALDSPHWLAVDGSGNVYVTGFATDNVFKITSGGVVTEIIDATGDGAANTLVQPNGIAVDASGNVYVTGGVSDNAFQITPGGLITEIIDATGDGAGNTLNAAFDVAADSSGNVYVSAGFSDNAFKIQLNLFVDASATSPASDGTSWTDAYTNLQDALADPGVTGGAISSIWVADGTYMPDGGRTPVGGGHVSGSGANTATFQLLNGVAIYGGFAGTETSFDQRDIQANETILSGDLSGDDTPIVCTQDSDCGFGGALCADDGFCVIFMGTSENSFHVVTGDGTNSSAVLDGFTISRGKADVACCAGNDRGGGMSTIAGSPTVSNCVFKNNWAKTLGGAMFNGTGSSATLTSCTFKSNATEFDGGGISNQSASNGEFRNCQFLGNRAGQSGGGVINENSNPSFVNCKFQGNVDGGGGGAGMYNWVGSSPQLVNCTFSGNRAFGDGGGMFNDNSHPAVTNCTFGGNSSNNNGGGMWNFGSNPTVDNSIFWGNVDDADGGSGGPFMDESAQIHTSISSPVVNYSIVMGGWTGAGDPQTNSASDPLFVDADGPDDILGNDDDDLSLSEGSPAVDAGDNDALPADTSDLDNDGDTAEALPIDLAGAPRRLNDPLTEPDPGNPGALGAPVVDMGALEFVSGVLLVDDSAVGGDDGSSWADAHTSLQDALGVAATVNADADPFNDITQIWVGAATYYPDRDAANPGGTCDPGPCDRTATFQLLNGVAIYGGFAGGETSLDLRDIEANETILSGDLQGDDTPIACTVDSPDCDSNGGLCGDDGFCIIHDNDGENSHHVVTGSGTDATAVVDGFTITAGRADSPLGPRGGGMCNDGGSPTVTNCTFSGNSAFQNGGGMFNSSSSPTMTNCTFSGNSAIFGSGGGMFNVSSSPMVTNCTFSGNSAEDGGGMFNDNSSPTVTNCTFSENTATGGGGMFNFNSSSPTVTNCVFSGNDALFGGGMINRTGSPTVTGCTFSGNSATQDGGGMYNTASNPTLTGCTFSGNSASCDGGGMYNISSSNPTVTNCTFSGNLASGSGGGMSNFTNSSPTVTNCTFSGNWALSGGGMYNDDSSSPTVTNCTFNANTAFGSGGGMFNNESSPTVTNCTFSGNRTDGFGGGMHNANTSSPTVTNTVLWGNVDDADGDGGGPFMDESAQIHTISGTPVVNYSIVMGGWTGAGGMGNSSGDPLLVDADGADNILGTEDDNLRLLPCSLGIDSGDNSVVTASTDLDGNPRLVDDPGTLDTGNGTPPIVDMGAFEFQLANIDCNLNGVPDSCDIDDLTSDDCNGNDVPDECEIDENSVDPGGPFFCTADCDPDCNDNGIPDECDIASCGAGLDPSCDDCNLNGVPDGCDIAVMTSQDADVDGVPDECVLFTSGGGTNDWSDGGNWDLAGDFPDNDAVTFNVTIDANLVASGRAAPQGQTSVILDIAVTIDSLRLLNGATLEVAGTADKNLRIATSGGILITAEQGSSRSRLRVANNRTITAALGSFTIDSSGLYEALDPLDATTLGTLDVAKVEIISRCPDDFGGEMSLSGAMEVHTSGDFVLDAGRDCLPCSSGGRAGGLRSLRGGKTRPTLRVRHVAAMSIGGDFVLIEGASIDFGSSVPLVVEGSFDNQSTCPDFFNWTAGGIIFNGAGSRSFPQGPGGQFFEVAGRDFGPNLAGFANNFAVGEVEVASGRSVAFVDRFDNDRQGQTAQEALYVATLRVGVGATVEVDNCSVYYQQIIPPEAESDVVLTGTARFEQLPPTPISSPVAAPPPHDILKNRYISIDPRGASGNNPSSHHIRVMVDSSQVNGQVESGPWWATDPVSGAGLSPATCISVLSTTKPAMEPDWSACPTVHLTGCPIIPTTTYAISAESGGSLSADILLDTQAKPGVKWHGDCVGFFDGTIWTPPNGTTSIDDAVAGIKTFQDPDAFNATHLSVTDMVPNLNGAQINLIVNINDVFSIILGFQGQEYPGPDLTQCP